MTGHEAAAITEAVLQAMADYLNRLTASPTQPITAAGVRAALGEGLAREGLQVLIVWVRPDGGLDINHGGIR